MQQYNSQPDIAETPNHMHTSYTHLVNWKFAKVERHHYRRHHYRTIHQRRSHHQRHHLWMLCCWRHSLWKLHHIWRRQHQRHNLQSYHCLRHNPQCWHCLRCSHQKYWLQRCSCHWPCTHCHYERCRKFTITGMYKDRWMKKGGTHSTRIHSQTYRTVTPINKPPLMTEWLSNNWNKPLWSWEHWLFF